MFQFGTREIKFHASHFLFKMQANVFHKFLFSISLHYPKKEVAFSETCFEGNGDFFFLTKMEK